MYVMVFTLHTLYYCEKLLKWVFAFLYHYHKITWYSLSQIYHKCLSWIAVFLNILSELSTIWSNNTVLPITSHRRWQNLEITIDCPDLIHMRKLWVPFESTLDYYNNMTWLWQVFGVYLIIPRTRISVGIMLTTTRLPMYSPLCITNH